MNLLNHVLERVSPARIRVHIAALEGVRHPVRAPDALEQAADYIHEHLRGLGYHMTEQRFTDEGREFRNIIATRRGFLHPDRRMVVLAHYDTVAATPGADDNASGVAVLLELAALLAPFRFERTLQLIGVSLEEAREDDPLSGTRGSRALAAHAAEQGWVIDGVVVLESVAYADDSAVQSAPAGIPVEVPKAGNFLAVVGNEDSCQLAEEFALAVEEYQVGLPYVTLTVPGTGVAIPDARRSDHAPFWDSGYRAIMLTDTTNFRNPHYHQPTDTLETLNMEFAARVCRAVGGMVMNVAGLDPTSR